MFICITTYLLYQVLSKVTADLEYEQAESKAARDKYQTLLDVSPDAILVHSDYRIDYANQAALKLFEATEEQLLGHDILDVIHPSYHDLVKSRVDLAYSAPGTQLPTIEQKIRTLNGHYTFIDSTTISFVYLGRVVAQSVLRNITDRKTIEKKLHIINAELSHAYDSTLEGWSRALDLRDHETEGHSARVTALTVKLGSRLKLSYTELLHLKRGALLHDIGKMGVPDMVLLKPGPLDDEEWKQMQRHPNFAYELLNPIEFLHDALAIPYCHHERWDGAGYPKGLEGEGIPLSARIFSIIDVWDALRSDRPYRKAWSFERTYQYMEDESGKMFDPELIKVFLELVKEEQECQPKL